MKLDVHRSHIGVNGCLRRARECMFWPGMSAEIKKFIGQCETCRRYETAQQKETLMSHEMTERPWEKVGMDIFTLYDVNYLVLIDYYSNLWEVNRLEDTKANTCIRKIKAHFARNGIPDVLISDNGSQFVSERFGKFAQMWGFEHRVSSPGHQQANGKAESAVKAAKKLIRKAFDTGDYPYLAILAHRNTPSEGMETSPAQRLLGRRCKTLQPTTVELLRPESVPNWKFMSQRKKLNDKQANYYNRDAKDLQPLEEGDIVRMRPFRLGQKSWDRAIVKRRYDERSYEVETNRGNFRRSRADIKKTAEQDDQLAQTESDIGKKSIVDVQSHTPVAIRIENDLSTTNSNEDQYTALESVINDDDDNAHEIERISSRKVCEAEASEKEIIHFTCKTML